jgi:outer membrane protein assembly complex protein YaeT
MFREGQLKFEDRVCCATMAQAAVIEIPTGNSLKRGGSLPCFRPVCLAWLLWWGVCAAQQPATVADGPSPGGEESRGLNSLQGVKVGDVRVQGPAVEHPEWLEPLVVQKADQPLDKYKVRQSVQALYNTGRFAEVQVQAQRSPQGELVLIFDARENYFFGSIRVEGAPARPSDTQLVGASRLALGEKFTEDKMKAAMGGMQRVLQDAGYYRAVIQTRYEWTALDQQVKVLFAVTRGQPARVGAISMSGNGGLTPEEFSKTAKLHPGQRVSDGLASRAMQRVRKRLQKRGFLEAQVTLTQRSYHPETNALDYTFEIVRGPVVAVTVEGVNLRRGTLKRLVPVFEENAVDEDLLKEGARNIQDYFQTKGYFDVKVSFAQKEAAGEREAIIYTVEKNARQKLSSVVIRGNEYFRTADLRERMQIQSAGFFLRHGLFSQALLARDIQAIEVLYRSNGFLQVKVTSEINPGYKGKKDQIQVALAVSEGPQTTVGKVTIEGNTVLSLEQLRPLISAIPGQPYSDATVIDDQTEVMNAYFNRGFPDVRFEYATKAEEGDPTKLNITYKITEGRQVFVNRVLIAGLHYTRPFVVGQQMKIHPGRPLSQLMMLDSQNGLYNLGLFNEVNMAVQNPDGESEHKNVNFQLTEAKRYTFDYGFGLEVQTGQAAGPTNPQGATGVSPRVSFGVTRLNFRGRDETINLKLRYGNLEKLALIGFTEPRWFGNPNLVLDFTAFYQQTNDVSTFTATRAEGAVQLRQRLSRKTTLLYRMIYRRVSTSNLVISPSQVPLFSQPVRVGLPAFSYIRDTRDNPIDSHKGTLNAGDVGVASSIFGSETNFVRSTGQNTSYYLFDRGRWVFARNTRIGIEEPFAGTSAAVVAPGPGAPPPSSFIPLPERFFSGGATSLRGFGVNQAGPRDLATGLPLGGEALFINNLELRSPPVPLPYIGNNLSVVMFNDVGNVFTTPNAMFTSLYKFTQPNRETCLNPAVPNCNFNFMSFAVGGGLRYRTPIGPVSFDIGYNVNPPAFPVSAPIPPTPTSPAPPPFSSVLRHINFFFNIGQTF